MIDEPDPETADASKGGAAELSGGLQQAAEAFRVDPNPQTYPRSTLFLDGRAIQGTVKTNGSIAPSPLTGRNIKAGVGILRALQVLPDVAKAVSRDAQRREAHRVGGKGKTNTALIENAEWLLRAYKLVDGGQKLTTAARVVHNEIHRKKISVHKAEKSWFPKLKTLTESLRRYRKVYPTLNGLTEAISEAALLDEN